MPYALRGVVVDVQFAVGGVHVQRLPLIHRVRDGLARRAFGKNGGLQRFQPDFEVSQNRRTSLLTQRQANLP